VQDGWGSHAGPAEKAPGVNVPGLTDVNIHNHQETGAGSCASYPNAHAALGRRTRAAWDGDVPIIPASFGTERVSNVSLLACSVASGIATTMGRSKLLAQNVIAGCGKATIGSDQGSATPTSGAPPRRRSRFSANGNPK
jgi:hypothetical protein